MGCGEARMKTPRKVLVTPAEADRQTTGLESQVATPEHTPKKSRWPSWQERLNAGWISDSRGCWVWQRSRNNRGYGVIYFDGRLHLAHRAAWLLAHGTWPAQGMVTDHICNNKACVNPAHLRELTNSENIARAYPRGDERTERRRMANRAAKARQRAKLSEGGGRDRLV